MNQIEMKKCEITFAGTKYAFMPADDLMSELLLVCDCLIEILKKLDPKLKIKVNNETWIGKD